MERVSTILPLATYGLLAVVHLLPDVGRRVRHPLWLAGGGAVVHALILAVGMLGGFAPGLPQALSGAALGVMLAYLWAASGRMRGLGMLLAPLAVVLLATSLVVPRGTVAALRTTGASPWLPVHIGLMFAGVAGFGLSFAVGVAYLVVRFRLKNRQFSGLGRLPPLELLDRVQFRATLFGFIFLTLGIAAGGAWAAATLAQPWVLDPKVVFTLGLWLWYAVSLQARLIAGLRGRWSALFSIVGFSGMVFSIVALNFLSDWHGYAL